MTQLLTRQSDGLVTGIWPDDATLTQKTGAVTVQAPDRAPVTYPYEAAFHTAEPPTQDANRYTYDPGAGTFTDTWPYAELSKVQFLDALQRDGGASDSDLVSSRNDSTLASFWLKFELAQSISRDDAKTEAGLQALVDNGYLTSSGKQAVKDNWPRGRP